MLKRLKLRLLAIFCRRKIEAELDEELRYHLERVIERLTESGMDAQEARVEALRGFGGLEQKKEECRTWSRSARTRSAFEWRWARRLAM
jgi:hypothetical protein